MPSPAPRTILVTGSMGFLGKHLVRRLLKDGHTVIGLDKDVDEQEVQKLEEDYSGRHRFAQGDLLKAFDIFAGGRGDDFPPLPGKFRCNDKTERTISEIFKDFKPDWVTHLAAMAQESVSRQFPDVSYAVNRKMMESFMIIVDEYWEKLTGQKREDFRIYFQSTVKVYLYDEIAGLATETSPYVRKGEGNASQYGKDKASDEQFLILSASVEPGFPFLIGNLVNVIGPEDEKNKERLIQGAVHTWVRGLGPHKIVKANLGHKRQYIPVSDACNAIITILENGEVQNKYNISNGVTLSNEQAIQLAQEVFQELIKEGKLPPVKTEYIATDEKFRPGADKEDPEEGVSADKLYALGYRPQHPGIEGIKLAIREMILAEWDTSKQERAISVLPPGNVPPDALKAAKQAGNTIVRDAIQGEKEGYSLNYYEKFQPSVKLKIVVDGSSEHRQLNRAQEEILSRFKAEGIHPVSADHEVSKEDDASRGRTEIKFFVEVPLSEIKRVEKLLNTWMGKKPAIGTDVIEGLDTGNTEHSGPKPGTKGGKARRSL